MLRLAAATALSVLTGLAARAQVLVDPGFEEWAVVPGRYSVPATGPWQFENDAGTVRSPSPNTSTGVLHTWSATRDAYEGAQYASTYAGLDRIRQQVRFDVPGLYELSVAAFAPSGTLTIPGVFENGPLPLIDGRFRFLFGTNRTGDEWIVPAGEDWARYSTTVTVDVPGTYDVGVANTLQGVYFVNYDSFAIRAVPEPQVVAILATAIAGAACRRRKRAG